MSVPLYISNHRPQLIKKASVKKGDYVVATKYSDGDPGDQFAIGFFDQEVKVGPDTRYLVVDSNGQQFRHNGFRRVERVGSKRGEWMVKHLTHIEVMMDKWSVWHWYHAPWRELMQIDSLKLEPVEHDPFEAVMPEGVGKCL